LSEDWNLKMIKNFIKNESGATAIEYGLLAALISVAAIVAMKFVGSQLSMTMAYVGSEMKNARRS